MITGAVPPSIGLTRIPASDSGHPQTGWAKVPHTNGLAVDPSGRWLYVDRDPPASSDGEIDRILISHPATVEVVARLGAGTFPDDMSVDANGARYVAAFVTGKVYRLDTVTHAVCAIASGLSQPTDVVFAGAGWPAHHLFVTTAKGDLYELSP